MDDRRLGDDLVQQLKPFRFQRAGDHADAGDVAARLVHAFDQAVLDRVAVAEGEDDGDRGGRRLRRQSRPAAAIGRDHRHLAIRQIRRQGGKPVVLTARPAVLDRNIDPFDKTGLGQPLLEPGHVGFPRFGRGDVEKADDRHRRLLRARRERPCRRRSADQRHEIAASDESRHLIPPAGRVTA